MSLQLVTAATGAPLDWLSEVKGHLRLDDDEERARVENVLVPAAVDWCENITNRALITQTWKLYLDTFPGACFPGWRTDSYALAVPSPASRWIELPKPPLQSVTHVKYYDDQGVQQTWSSSLYDVDPPAGAPFDARCQPYRLFPKVGQTWPTTQAGRRNAVEIQFVCGYGDESAAVPGALRAAMLLVVGEQFERREESVVGTIINEVPLSAKRLASPFRVHLLGGPA